MQKFLLFLLIILYQQRTYAQLPTEKINLLIENRQYADAWQEIVNNSPSNTKGDIVYKSEFCLKYFAHTVYHQKFYFQNLKDDETLFDYRSKSASTAQTFAPFNPEKELKTLLANDSTSAPLHLAAGDFYYDVYITYHDQWLKGSKELMANFYYHYDAAYRRNLKTDQSVYALSLFYQSRKTFSKAKELLLECLTMNSAFAPAHYNLAYSYSLEDSLYEAISHAQKAYEFYEEKDLKSDAASMAGILLGDLKKFQDAINWLLISDALAPGNYHVYQALLNAYLALNKKQETLLITTNLYQYDWKTGKVFNGILESYLEHQKAADLEMFLLAELEREKLDQEFRAFVHLHLTQLYLYQEDKIKAENSLNDATIAFAICYDKDHSIYRLLEKLKYTIEQK